MEIIWVLVLSVCTTDRCITQTVLETNTKNKFFLCIQNKLYILEFIALW